MRGVLDGRRGDLGGQMTYANEVTFGVAWLGRRRHSTLNVRGIFWYVGLRRKSWRSWLWDAFRGTIVVLRRDLEYGSFMAFLG